jgi:hypothetical protein
VTRPWARRRKDAVHVILPDIVHAIADDVSRCSPEELERRADRTFGTQPVVNYFFNKWCVSYSSNTTSSVRAAISSIFEMFEEHQGRRLREIDGGLLDRCAHANQLLIEELGLGRRRPAIAEMAQPAVMRFVCDVIDKIGREEEAPRTPAEFFNLFLLLKTIVDAADLSYAEESISIAQHATTT